MARLGSEFQIKVSTQELRNTALEANVNIEKLNMQWASLLQTVRNTRYYWIGDGADTKRKEIEVLNKDMEEMSIRLKEYVTDLRMIAGGYESAERANKGDASVLPVDVIF